MHSLIPIFADVTKCEIVDESETWRIHFIFIHMNEEENKFIIEIRQVI